MTLLNTANKVYLGSNAAAKVYLGSSLVWTPPAAAPTSRLLVSYGPPGTDRNDFDGEIGVRLGIGGANVTFTWMGARRHSAAQTGLHTMKLYEWFADALVCSGTIDYSSVAVDAYAWVAVPSFTMLASGYYSLMFPVVAYDGQIWCNPGPITYAASITNVYGCYRIGTGGMGTVGINEEFIGLDLGW